MPSAAPDGAPPHPFQKERPHILGKVSSEKKFQTTLSNLSLVALQIGQIPGGCSRAQRYPQILQRQTGREKIGLSVVEATRTGAGGVRVRVRLSVYSRNKAQIEPHIMPFTDPYPRSGGIFFPDRVSGNLT